MDNQVAVVTESGDALGVKTMSCALSMIVKISRELDRDTADVSNEDTLAALGASAIIAELKL